MLPTVAKVTSVDVSVRFVKLLPSTAGNAPVESNCTTLNASIPTFNVATVPNPKFVLAALADVAPVPPNTNGTVVAVISCPSILK